MDKIKDTILSELMALDKPVLDESSAGKDVVVEDLPDLSPNHMVLTLIDGIPNNAAAAILSAWENLKPEVKEALKSLYSCVEGLGRSTDMKMVVKELNNLADLCGDDKRLLPFYEAAVKDVKKYAPIVLGKVNIALMEKGIKR